MKKVLSVLVIIAVTTCLFSACTEQAEPLYGTLNGRFLRSDITETVYIITESGSPIEMNVVHGSDVVFDGIGNGDKIRIKCGAILETYPGKTDVYDCEVLEKGSIELISEDVMDRLRDFGRVKY